MLGIIITFLTFVLILITLFMMLVILMQRPNTNAGMGAAFGGGVTDSTFGAETTNVLTRATRWSAIAFFVVALILYVLYLVYTAPPEDTEPDLPEVTASEEAAPGRLALPEGMAGALEEATSAAGEEAAAAVEAGAGTDAEESAPGAGNSP